MSAAARCSARASWSAVGRDASRARIAPTIETREPPAPTSSCSEPRWSPPAAPDRLPTAHLLGLPAALDAGSLFLVRTLARRRCRYRPTVATTPVDSGLPIASERRARATFSGWSRGRRRVSRSTRIVFVALAAVTALLAAVALQAPSWVAPTMLLVPLLAGAALLTMSWLVALVCVAVLLHVVVLLVSEHEGRRLAEVLAFIAIAAVVLAGARARSQLGVLGSRGDAMLFELRQRLTTEGELPGLPGRWRGEVVHRSAHGESFGGDFLVSALSPDRTRLEIALVDVSGNGLAAGTRALMLSGAFGGLIGAVAADKFLPAANHYLLRQRWDEGFATGVHLAIDLVTGSFQLGSAGHPPAVQFHAGSGSWEVGTAAGPAFGLVPDAQFVFAVGQLLPGDAMLLYTDGLVEKADRDISLGIDRLLGEAERLVTGGFESGANRLMMAVSDTESDDRACVLIWRT